MPKLSDYLLYVTIILFIFIVVLILLCRPRLGPMLHRVVGVGALYFLLACVESYLRVMRNKPDIQNELLVASIPLAVLDTGICWWIFTSLVQTTRTLRLRRFVKLTKKKEIITFCLK